MDESTINLISEEGGAEVMGAEEKLALRNMMEAGLFYGLSKSKTNPKMKAYIAATKSGIEIIDLVKTMEALRKACDVLKDKIKSGGIPLLVGTTPAVKASVEDVGKKLGIPYVTERWLGGTLTNFDSISTRIGQFKKLKEDKTSGNLEKYTKKERLMIEKKIQKLEKFFSGLETMEKKKPAVMVIFDLKNHEIAAREARKTGVTSIAVMNTNADPELVDYPVVANDRNPKSIAFIASFIEQAVAEGQKEAASKAAEVNQDKKETTN